MRSLVVRFAVDCFRSLKTITRAPAGPALAIATLALGIGASLVAYVVVRDVLTKPLPYPDAARLVRLTELDARARQWWPSFPNCADWRRVATRIFDDVGCADPDDSPRPVLVNGRPLKVRLGRASAGLFNTLGVSAVVGRTFATDENRPGGAPVAMVSWRFWRAELGSAPLAGVRITVGESVAPVVGVLPEDFGFLGDGGAWSVADVWTPLERDANLGGRGSHGYHTVARLRAGVTLDEARREMTRLSKALIAEHHEPTQAQDVALRPLKDFVTRTAVAPMRVLSWAAAAVLLVACLNFGATILARGLDRQRELRLRLSLGATRGDLLRLLLTDAGALAIPATALGLALAAAALAWIRGEAAGTLPRIATAHLDATATAVAVSVAVICAVAAAVLPALSLSSRAIADGLASRGSVGGTTATQRMWSAFVATQVAVTLVLVCESGLLLRSFAAASSVDLGYSSDQVLAVDLALPEARYPTPASRLAFFRRAADRVRALPAVRFASLTNQLPHVTSATTSNTTVPGRPPRASMLLASYRTVEPSYFETLGIPVEDGADVLGAGRAFVDRSLAADLWTSSPRGSQVETGFGGVLQVAGVVGAVREWDQDETARTVYAPFGETERVPTRMFLLVKVSGNLSDASRNVDDALKSLDPLLPIDQQPLMVLAAESLRSRRVLAAVAAAFTIIAVLLACAGTYAMVVFAVRRRFREAAIRLALGGAPSHVRRHFIRIGLGPASAGVVIGAALAKPAAGLVSAQLFRVSPGDPVVLGSAVVALSLAALLAATLPSRRAARADPAVLLRDD